MEDEKHQGGYSCRFIQNLVYCQHGQEPDDWKPMPTVGSGVKEIRVRDASGAFRVIYVAKLTDAIYVIHCFQKKTEKTSKSDLALAQKRYRALLKEMEP